MTLENIFTLASAIAGVGWVLLVAALFVSGNDLRRQLLQVAGRWVPLVLAAGYAVLLFWYGPRVVAEGHFFSLEGVSALFAHPEVLLIGWVHYLAFDLWVGRWEVDDALGRGMSRWLLLPCLFFTLMSGPFGLLLYILLRRFPGRQ